MTLSPLNTNGNIVGIEELKDDLCYHKCSREQKRFDGGKRAFEKNMILLNFGAFRGK